MSLRGATIISRAERCGALLQELETLSHVFQISADAE
jgi:hypothetical protein